MKIEFQNSRARFSFLCRTMDIKNYSYIYIYIYIYIYHGFKKMSP